MFGYSSLINPLEFKGKCVKKDDLNGIHNGIIIDCPITEVEDGFIYQKLMETTNKDNFTEEVRVAIINNKIPYVLFKQKNLDNFFGNGFDKANLISPEEFFNSEEISLIKKFCTTSNFDFGELDVMRNQTDGRIILLTQIIHHNNV